MQKAFSTQQRNHSIATLAIVSIVLLVMLYGYWNIQQDDSYIVYSYAYNLANGYGYVFNIGERINATTSPLYTILLSLIAVTLQYFPFISLPLIGHLIGTISLFFICLFLMETFTTERTFLFPFILPFTFLLTPLLPNAIGMETFLAIMLAVMCLYLYSRGKLLAASLACSFAVLARPDMLLLGAVMLIYDLIRNHRLPSIYMSLIFLCPVFVWLLFSYMYFGELLPTTLSAKLGQTQSGRWGSGLIFFKGLLSQQVWQTSFFSALVTGAILSGFVILFLRRRHWSIFRHPVFHLILLWNLVYLGVYGFILNPPAYPWYYTPLSTGIALLMTIPIEACYRFIRGKDVVNNRTIIAVLFSFLVTACFILPVYYTMWGDADAKYENYKLAAEWLNANVRAGSSVGANEIGVLRYYYKKGPVIDGLGLVTSEVAEHVRERDYSWYIQRYRPDYLMFNHPHRPILESMVESDWFQEDYMLRTIINTSRRAVAIYERQN